MPQVSLWRPLFQMPIPIVDRRFDRRPREGRIAKDAPRFGRERDSRRFRLGDAPEVPTESADRDLADQAAQEAERQVRDFQIRNSELCGEPVRKRA